MQRVARVGVVGCVAVAVALGAVYFVRAVDHLGETASTNAALNFDDREFAGGNSLVADKRALYQARALIPEDGSYRVLTGSSVAGESELTQQYIDQFVRYFLMPRRPAQDAPWIICYGCDTSAIGQPTSVVWTNGGGISILEVAA
jgi:hypothetical protein